MANHIEAVARKAMESVKAPATSQDTLDVHASELHVADVLRRLATQRYDAAKNGFIETFRTTVDTVRGEASKRMFKSTETLSGAEWVAIIAANTPASSIDSSKFVTELIKAGVDRNIIDQCQRAATKRSTPALTITTSRAKE